LNYRLTARAAALVDLALDDSAERHGAAAAERYSDLITAAMRALSERPRRPGVKAIAEAPGLFAYPLRLVRIGPGRRVKRPPHILIFRVLADGVVEILGLVHERMDFVPAAIRLAGAAGRRGP
jgi:plasmid stabilization system protein ParE